MQINHKAKSKMKKFLILIPVLLMLNGCATSKLANLAKQLKGDAASVRFTVHTIYGTVDFCVTWPSRVSRCWAWSPTSRLISSCRLG